MLQRPFRQVHSFKHFRQEIIKLNNKRGQNNLKREQDKLAKKKQINKVKGKKSAE